MSVRSNPLKTREWTDRFVRFENANQTVVEFCQSEGISQPSFYQWRKKLGIPKRSIIPQPKPTTVAAKRLTGRNNFRPVALTIPHAQQGLKVRLPGGVELELGNDPEVILAIVKQLVESTGLQTC